MGSSVKSAIFALGDTGMSFMKTEKWCGDRQDHLGTPDSIDLGGEVETYFDAKYSVAEKLTYDVYYLVQHIHGEQFV